MQKSRTSPLKHLLIAACAFAVTSANASAMAAPLDRSIRSLAADILPAGTVAVYAELLEGDTPLVAINADKLMPPASCMKIVTAATALTELGVDYRFSTAFLAAERPDAGAIDTLYIKGNGDPFITPEALWGMAGTFNDHGIYRIRGDIIIDDTFFDGPDYPHKDSGWYHAWEPLTGAVAPNFDVVEFIVAPGPSAGSLAHVAVNPPSPYIQLINKVKTGNQVRISVTREVTDDHEIFTVYGEIARSAKLTTLARSIKYPVRYAGALFKEMLAQNNVQIEGNAVAGKTPKDAYPLFEVPSRPLSLLVREMNKFSSNFIAEQIIKHLGGLRTGKPGTTERGLVAVREWLRSIGIKPYDYTLENGSGLSAKSTFTAKQLVRVLKAAGNNPSIAPDFMGSLSILGVDGTMRHWHAVPELRGILRAKTGTLKGVTALSGFVPDKNGHLIAFSILAQGVQIGINEARDAQVKIAHAIAKSH